LFVPTDPRIAEFIEKALAAGMPHDSLVGPTAGRKRKSTKLSATTIAA